MKGLVKYWLWNMYIKITCKLFELGFTTDICYVFCFLIKMATWIYKKLRACTLMSSTNQFYLEVTGSKVIVTVTHKAPALVIYGSCFIYIIVYIFWLGVPISNVFLSVIKLQLFKERYIDNWKYFIKQIHKNRMQFREDNH